MMILRARSQKGQATTEMVFLIPLLLMVTAGVISVVYMCWQGIKVQQAANLVARIQGQERVAGGVSLNSIQQDNGTNRGSDIDPTTLNLQDPNQAAALQAQKANVPNTAVYGKILKAAHDMFGAGEIKDLYVPMPSYGSGGNTDQVKVVRVWQPPQIFGLNIPAVTLSATAYGGEDTHMYGLVRWGSTSSNAVNGGTGASGNSKFWTQAGNLQGND